MTGPRLHDLIDQAVHRHPDRDALRMGDNRWSFGQVGELAGALASHLGAAGVGPGDRVVLMMGNRPELIAAIYGVSRLGAAAVLLSPAWKEREVEHALKLTSPVHAIVDATTAPLLASIGRLTDVDEERPETSGRRGPGPGTPGTPTPPTPPIPPTPDTADAVLVFSSGTTGLPKAVRHTHRSLGIATSHWCTALGLTADDRFQVATPPSHILGLLNLLAATAAGATVRLHRRFDLEAVLGCIGSDRITLEMAVAPIALAMANHPDLESFDLSSLRYIMWGATPVTESVARIVTARTGVRWLPAYGASELPVIAANPIDDPEHWRLDSAGLPPEGVELRVADLDTGKALEPGGVGEIQARSPSVMAGYLPEEANDEAFADGWYRTGDVGWLETEGWVHLTDRCKEMIKVKGFQVAPAEIEAVLHGHPAVVDCAVFGVPDEAAGELPVAAVQLDPDRPVPAGELQKLVCDSLATYKQLQEVVVVEAVPRLPSGKVLRRTLRDEWLARS
jgi:acyl-CoA synthetase (AMP-forming)/AMP-acid ligase II